MTASLVLVSHPLCPYVQRAAIVLAEKGVTFERRDIDLANKPPWFLDISPLGKTPVLMVGDRPVFESAVICEYLDETLLPRLHPDAPLDRARHRGWIEFASALLAAIAAFYSAADDRTLERQRGDIRRRLEQIESSLDDGPYFSGPAFSIVDAAFGPVFRYFDAFEASAGIEFFSGLARSSAWRVTLAARPSVRNAVRPDYPGLLRRFLLARGSALSRRMVPDAVEQEG